MKRYPLFDPPEYVSWVADPELVREYAENLAADSERHRLVKSLSREALLRLYEGLLRFRLHDIMLKRWVRQGVITKAWLGTGEEAATIGCVHALEKGDAVGPMIRNAGACHEMGMPVADMLRGYLGTADGPTAGRDLHVGDLDKGIITPISHVGSLVPVMTGVALFFRRQNRPRVALTWVGDGASRTAEFHEGLNLAAVQKLPFLCVVQNNQVALGTRVGAHTRADFRRLGEAYGVPTFVCDGNNVLDVWAATRVARERAVRGDGASVILTETFRMGGHATHDEAEARKVLPAADFVHWGRRDPIGLFEEHLLATSVGDRRELEAIETRVAAEIEQAAEAALASRQTSMPRGPEAVEGVYAGE